MELIQKDITRATTVTYMLAQWAESALEGAEGVSDVWHKISEINHVAELLAQSMEKIEMDLGKIIERKNKCPNVNLADFRDLDDHNLAEEYTRQSEIIEAARREIAIINKVQRQRGEAEEDRESRQ